MELVNVPEGVDLHKIAGTLRDKSKAWKIAFNEHAGIKEATYQNLTRSRVDGSVVSSVLTSTYNHILNQVEGGVGALANSSFLIEYDVRANMDRNAVYEPEVDGMTFRVDWKLNPVNVELYIGQMKDVIISGDLRQMVDDETVTNLNKFAEQVGLNQRDVKEDGASTVNAAARAIGHLTCGQNKLTRLVKGCLIYLDHLGVGAVDYKMPQIGVLDYNLKNIVGTLEASDTAYVWTKDPGLHAVNAVLVGMCMQYPNPVFRSSSHIRIPADAGNIYLVGQNLSANARKVCISADVIWGTLITYANSFRLGSELEAALAIACSLRQNRYLENVKLPRVVSGVDMVQPILSNSPSNVMDKTKMNLEASIVFGRVHQMLALVLVKDLITCAENSSDFKNDTMDQRIKNIISRDSHTILEYIERISVANILKLTSEMRWLEVLGQSGLSNCKKFSVLEGFWLVKDPKEVLKDGIIKCLKKGEKMTVSVNKIGVHVDTYSVFKKEIVLAGGKPNDNMPNGFFHVSVSGIRYGKQNTKKKELGKKTKKPKTYYSEGIPVEGEKGGLLDCPKDRVSPAVASFGWSGDDLLVAPKKAVDLSRISNKGKVLGKGEVSEADKGGSVVVGKGTTGPVIVDTGKRPTEPESEEEEEAYVETPPEGTLEGDSVFLFGAWHKKNELPDIVEYMKECLAKGVEMEAKIRAESERVKKNHPTKTGPDVGKGPSVTPIVTPLDTTGGTDGGKGPEVPEVPKGDIPEKPKTPEGPKSPVVEAEKPTSFPKDDINLDNPVGVPVVFQFVEVDGKLIEWKSLEDNIYIYVDGVEIVASEHKDLMVKANEAVRAKGPEKTPKPIDPVVPEPSVSPKIVRVPVPKKPHPKSWKMPSLSKLVTVTELTIDMTSHQLTALEDMSTVDFLYGNNKYNDIVNVFKYYLMCVPIQRIYEGKVGWFRRDEEWENVLIEHVNFFLGHEDHPVAEFPPIYHDLITKIRNEVERKEESKAYAYPTEEILAEIEAAGNELHIAVSKDPHYWKPAPKQHVELKDLNGLHCFMYNNSWWMDKIKSVFKTEKGVKPPSSDEMSWAAYYLDQDGPEGQFHLIWKLANGDPILMFKSNWVPIANQMEKVCKDANKWCRKLSARYPDEVTARNALMKTSTMELDPTSPWTKEEFNATLDEVLEMRMGKKAKLLSTLVSTGTLITYPVYYVHAYRMFNYSGGAGDDLKVMLSEYLKHV